MRAAAYVRTSTDQQKYSLENQLATIEAYCAGAQMELVEIFADIGKSGISLAGRPGLRGLLDAVVEGVAPFDAVIVFDISRWGRFQDVDEGAFYEHRLRLAGAPVFYCAEVFEDDNSPTATIMKAMRRAMAAEYSRDLSRRISAGARRAARRGFYVTARPPYGYRRTIVDADGSVVCVARPGERKLLSSHHTILAPGPSEEIAAVRRMFKLFGDQHMTIASIARLMSTEPWPQPQNGWKRALVRKMLANEQYIGNSVFGRTKGLLGARRARTPQCEWERSDNTHPGIVPRSLFARVQKRLKARRRFTREEIVEGLRALFQRDAMVTQPAISASSNLPSLAAIHSAFGSMSAAYHAAGVVSPLKNSKKQMRLLRDRGAAAGQ